MKALLALAALPLLLLAVGALLTLLVGAVTSDDTAGTTIGVATTVGAALWLLQTPPAVVAPTLGLSAALLPRLFAHSIYELEPKLASCLEIAEWPGGTESLEKALFDECDCATLLASCSPLF